MRTAAPLAEIRSPRWAGSDPAVTVVVATHDRRPFLAELVDALEVLESPDGGLELVIADDGSSDGTWEELVRLVGRTSLRMLALKLAASGGPSVPRNTAVAIGRGRLLALTDDDCLPEPGWVRALARALDDGAGVVQGCTLAAPGGQSGPWDRAIEVRGLSGLYETCNLGVSREMFLRLGGFRVAAALRHAPRGFGEDVALGAAAAREAGAAWAPRAVVRHRWLPGSYREHLRSRRRLVAFPSLVGEVPELRERMWHRAFLTRRTASTDAALAGLALAVVSRRAGPLLAALPWLALAVPDARGRPGRPLPWRLAQVAIADVLASASLAEGTVRSRQLLL